MRTCVSVPFKMAVHNLTHSDFFLFLVFFQISNTEYSLRILISWSVVDHWFLLGLFLIIHSFIFFTLMPFPHEPPSHFIHNHFDVYHFVCVQNEYYCFAWMYFYYCKIHTTYRLSFKAFLSVRFSGINTFTMLCNYHHYLFLKLFNHSKQKLLIIMQ